MPKHLMVTGPSQVVFEETPMPDCPEDGLLVRSRLTAISAGTEVRVYRGIPVDKEGAFLHTSVPFQYPCIIGESIGGRGARGEY